MVPWTAKVGVLGLKLKAETEIAQSFADTYKAVRRRP